jgi:hypothetical protein
MGGGSLCFPLLKAFRIDAKDGFLENVVLVVANEGCAECEKSVLGLLVKRAVADPAESIEVEESSRE